MIINAKQARQNAETVNERIFDIVFSKVMDYIEKESLEGKTSVTLERIIEYDYGIETLREVEECKDEVINKLEDLGYKIVKLDYIEFETGAKKFKHDINW